MHPSPVAYGRLVSPPADHFGEWPGATLTEGAGAAWSRRPRGLGVACGIPRLVRGIWLLATIFGALLALALPGTARAYGPMTHMAEAQAALALLGEEEDAALSELFALVNGSPEARMYLLLGAILPDFREASEAIRFHTHDRGFAAHLLATVVKDSTRSPTERALALGLVSHVCSDIAAQVFAVPRFVALGQVGAPDVMPGFMDDRPDGEAELLVEAILDVYYGDAETLLELYDHFQPEPPDPAVLDEPLEIWLEEAAAYFGAEATGDPTAIREEIHGTLGRVAAELTEERRRQLLGALDLAQEFNLGDVLILVDGVGLLDDLVSQGYEVDLDYGEIYRLQAVSPFFGDPRFFDLYPQDLAALGPIILCDAARGEPWLTGYPVWRAEPLAAATMQSLAGLPGSPLREGEETGAPPPSHGDVGVFDLWWEDPSTGLPVDAVSTASVSATALDAVELVTHLYPLLVAGSPEPFRLQVRKAVPEAPYLAGPVLASREVRPEDVAGAPTGADTGAASLGGAPPWEVRLTVPLGGDALVYADGLHAELVPASTAPETPGGVPGFTTAFEPWFHRALPAWRLHRPVYASQLATYDRFPRSLRVEPRVPDWTPPSAPLMETSPARISPDEPTLEVLLWAEDRGSGVVSYQLSLGTESGAADVVDATSVPALGPARQGSLRFTLPPERLAAGGALYVTAHAVNGADLAGPESRAGPVPIDPGSVPPGGKAGCGCAAGGSPSGIHGQARPGAPGEGAPWLLWVLGFLVASLRSRRGGW